MGTPFMGEIKIISWNFAPKGWVGSRADLLVGLVGLTSGSALRSFVERSGDRFLWSRLRIGGLSKQLLTEPRPQGAESCGEFFNKLLD